jgi:hypothetical protein
MVHLFNSHLFICDCKLPIANCQLHCFHCLPLFFFGNQIQQHLSLYSPAPASAPIEEIGSISLWSGLDGLACRTIWGCKKPHVWLWVGANFNSSKYYPPKPDPIAIGWRGSPQGEVRAADL